MAEQILDENDCKNVLKKFLPTKDFNLKTHKILDFHSPLQGLIGEHFTLRIEYTEDDKDKTQSEDFFLKTLSSNPLLFAFSKDLQVYEKEELFYNLLDEFAQLGIDTSYAPRGLFFKPFVVVLEDISEKFKGTPKRQTLDLQHSRCSLEAIAKFHASSIIYDKKNEGTRRPLKETYRKLLEDKLLSKEESLGTKYMSCGIQGLLYLIDLVLENYTTNTDFKDKLLEIFSSDIQVEGLLSGILHGDLWTSNLLHRYWCGTPVETKIIDFQIIKYGYLEQDVVEFLMLNTSRSLRVEYFEELVEHYYEKLTNILNSAGLSNQTLPSSKDFIRSCNNFKLAGKIRAAVDHSYTFMPDEIYIDITKSEESFKKFFFEDKDKYILECYNSNAEFRKILGEDIVELRELLFS